jgi:menaquinol-cytochrome c reductase iron-sulfur subunit
MGMGERAAGSEQQAASSNAPLTAEELSRRRFLTRLSVALGAVGAAAVGAPVIGFLLAPLFRKAPRSWRAVGAVDAFPVGTTNKVVVSDPAPLAWTGVAANTAAWLRREDPTTFVAYSIYCSHLGCPVDWLPDANLFLCPCHGGVYYKDGAVAAGPPPQPLTKYPVRITNGQVEIETSPIPIT